MIEINKNQPRANEITFPVLGGKEDEKGNFVPHEIYGTAFYINNNFFLTCGHTINNARSMGVIVLGFLNEDGTLSYSKVEDFEIFEKNDTGLIYANIPNAVAYPWFNQKLAMLNNVVSTGFPYGYDKINNQVLMRGFKGHITMVGYNHNFSKSPHYELSYQIPRGLSGGPLIFIHNNNHFICGITIGNEITEMIVDSFKEKTQEGDQLTIYERSEAFHRGIAIQTASFYDINSRILKMTFLDYLKINDMIK